MSVTENKNIEPKLNLHTNTTKNETQSKYIIKFSKTYRFDDQEYKELDLSGMEDMTATDLFTASKVFAMEGFISPKPEADPKFCCMIAAAATGIAKEELRKLSMKDASKVKDVVFDFFQNED